MQLVQYVFYHILQTAKEPETVKLDLNPHCDAAAVTSSEPVKLKEFCSKSSEPLTTLDKLLPFPQLCCACLPG